jgi:hypothetical protein
VPRGSGAGGAPHHRGEGQGGVEGGRRGATAPDLEEATGIDDEQAGRARRRICWRRERWRRGAGGAVGLAGAQGWWTAPWPAWSRPSTRRRLHTVAGEPPRTASRHTLRWIPRACRERRAPTGRGSGKSAEEEGGAPGGREARVVWRRVGETRCRPGAGAAGEEGGRVWQGGGVLYKFLGDFGPLDLKIDAGGALEGWEVGPWMRGRPGTWVRLPCATYHARQRTIVCRAFSIRHTTMFCGAR